MITPRLLAVSALTTVLLASPAQADIAARFELPAQPLTLDELRARMLPNVAPPPTLPPYEAD